MGEISILLVDDHGLFRESLGRLLETAPGIRVAAQCATVAEAMTALTESEPDVILLDYDLGEESGLQLLTELKHRASGSRVLMVTAGLPDEIILRGMEMGVSGIFLKHSSPNLLIQAIRSVAEGEVWLADPAFHTLLAERRNRADQLDRARPLTNRQREVLRGILDGLANKEIAWKLNTSETAVKAAVQELFHKAGVRTRSQLVRIAIEQHTLDWLSPAREKA
ncbi:MAG TPA: response regulator transcription factor [Acidobacteriaceae bacterium]|nr:response regulator transcription factor [Acidobacteriaceae bacterium]